MKRVKNDEFYNFGTFSLTTKIIQILKFFAFIANSINYLSTYTKLDLTQMPEKVQSSLV